MKWAFSTLRYLRNQYRRRYFRERCWLLVQAADGRLAHLAIGQRGRPWQVSFDWQAVYAREDACGDVAGFAHTHPPGSSARPSETDRLAMEGWASSLGRPLLCIIDNGYRKMYWEFGPDGDCCLTGEGMSDDPL